MKTVSIDGVDFADVATLTTELQAVSDNIQLVTYEPANNKRLNIRLNVDSIPADEERAIRNVVNDHLSQLAQVEAARQLQLQAEQTDVNTRFLTSNLANKTPAEIYTTVQGMVDSWGTVAQMRAGLRTILPLLAAMAANRQKREV